VIEELAPVVRDFVNAIGPELIPIIQQLGPILVDIALILKEQLPLAIDLTNAAIDALGVALTIVSGVIDFARKASEKFAEFYNSDFVASFRTASNAAVTHRDVLKDAFLNWTASALGSIRRFQQALFDFSASVRARFVDAFISSLGTTVRAIQSFAAEFISVIASLPSRAYAVGVQIMSGLGGGLTAGLTRVLGIARDIADSVSGTIREALDIRSPSRVMREIGVDTVEGFILGIKDKFSEVGDLMSGLGAQTTLAGNFTSRSGFESIALPGLQAAPAVTNVYVGNEFLARYVDGRVQAVDTRNRRVLSQGVRF
jgi:phage-related protein